MLVLRGPQVKALERAALPAWIAIHLPKFFPWECEALGDAGVRQLVREGIDRAVWHGFETGAQISQYIDLMFAFSPHFDTDPRTSWAQRILSNEALTPDLRMERLIEEALRQRQGS